MTPQNEPFGPLGPDDPQVTPDEPLADESAGHTPVEIEHRLTSLETVTQQLLGFTELYERVATLEATIANNRWYIRTIVACAGAVAAFAVWWLGGQVGAPPAPTTTLPTTTSTTTILPMP